MASISGILRLRNRRAWDRRKAALRNDAQGGSGGVGKFAISLLARRTIKICGGVKCHTSPSKVSVGVKGRETIGECSTEGNDWFSSVYVKPSINHRRVGWSALFHRPEVTLSIGPSGQCPEVTFLASWCRACCRNVRAARLLMSRSERTLSGSRFPGAGSVVGHAGVSSPIAVVATWKWTVNIGRNCVSTSVWVAGPRAERQLRRKFPSQIL